VTAEVSSSKLGAAGSSKLGTSDNDELTP
jgi:hypothetical protein